MLEDTEPYRLYNLDVFEYLHESPFGLYGSIPFMLAHKLGLTTGVFWWVGGRLDSVVCSWLREWSEVGLVAGRTEACVGGPQAQV